MSIFYIFVKCVNVLSEWMGKLGAWLFLVLSVCITYEVIMRHVFDSPTIWVDEVSRVLLVWVVFLSAASVLKHGQMVTIKMAFRHHNTISRKLAETLAFVMLFIFTGVAVYYGFELWWKALLAHHTTDTYLALPKWLTQAPVWLGCVLLFLQGAAQLIRVWFDDSGAVNRG